MAYKLIITEEAEQLLDRQIQYLLYRLKNEQAAIHLLDETERIYERLADNPYQFPQSKDTCLQKIGYREAICTGMNYVIIFRAENTSVYVLGIFHQLENYRKKVLPPKESGRIFNRPYQA